MVSVDVKHHVYYYVLYYYYYFLYFLWWSLWTLYLHACQVRVTEATQVFDVVHVLCISSAN